VVRFNGVQDFTAFANAADGTMILATVPAGAPLGANPISVSVNGDSASSLQDFTVIGPGPYITGFSPPSGGGGTHVTINGVHFISGNATGAFFNGRAGVNFFVQSDITITVDTPTGVTTGPISVRSSSSTNTTSANFFVPPIVTGFSPATGRSGTNVLITGTNFLGTLAVRFGGFYSSNFNVLSNGAISVVVSTGAITGPIRVDAPAGSATTTSNFVVLPTIFGFTPNAGPVGSSVTITGANLFGVTGVKFSGVTATFGGASFGQVTSVVPATAVSGPITVTTTNGTAISAQNFYLPASISTFTPTNSGPGSKVVITGVNFTNASAVSFNGTPAASFTVSNNTTISATVPFDFSTGPISVTTPAGTTNSAGLFYAPPGITVFFPTHGLPGTNVTITGSNFLGATAVLFNGLAATFHVTNNSTIGAIVPNNAQTGPITVIAPAGTNITSEDFVLDYTSELGVTVTDAPDPVFIKSNLVYSIQVINNGAFNAQNTIISNTLPSSVVLVAASTTQGTLVTNNNPIVANLGTLNIGNTVTVTLTVAPQVTGSITNKVTVSSDYVDPTPTNNTATAITTVLPLPILSISLIPNKVRVSWPQALSNFTLQFKNTLPTNVFWSNVTTTPSNFSGESIVIETLTNGSRFYRLRQ